ncbi:MAG: endonuclease/exonuclease/phosphatase family protein [Saprospiraceae bacterium]|nr:endonuclease/exonuclease/phosphatase family protein [Saprospiraceae bacterium]
MKNRQFLRCLSLSFYGLLLAVFLQAQASEPIIFDFDQGLKRGKQEFSGNGFSFTTGIDGKAMRLGGNGEYPQLKLDGLSLDGNHDFSIQCWVQTTSTKPMVFLAQKDFTNKGILAQMNPGWVLYSSGGTLAWSIGSGSRRINYERDNGDKLPISDGQWHQLTLTYNAAFAEFRIYFDGQNIALYKVGFDFSNKHSLSVGTTRPDPDDGQQFSPKVEEGKRQLQILVDRFNELGVGTLKVDEFIDLIVEPEDLAARKAKKGNKPGQLDQDRLSAVLEHRKELVSNPYTVYQNRALTNLKPVSKLYAIKGDRVVLNEAMAASFTAKEKLFPADFAMDQLTIWKETLSSRTVLDSYRQFQSTKAPKLKKKVKHLTVGVWNIWHGGIHWTEEKDGWDSRRRIVEILKERKVDVVLMQETYSSGDFIAAELGYYYATTSDWDYRFQGSNISVISRYPIEEIQVNGETEFNNVAVKLAISKTQKAWAMSNWYGMQQFQTVYDFHADRFNTAAEVPVFFGGDFNAVPHTDGGDSPASRKLLEAGFTDAFRSLNPDPKRQPGLTHRSGARIDQLYYQGNKIKNLSTEVVSTWPTGFPSDHYLIVSKFRLKR